jgi:hypothetical protein
MPPRKLPVLPKKVNEVVQDQLQPYLPSIGKPEEDSVFTRNRAYDLSFKGDKAKDISIGLKDIDEALVYYFENVIKPSVIQNGQKIPVPIIYGNAELWKDVQENGYRRDKNGKALVPLITFQRVSLSKNRELGNKLDGNKSHLYQSFEVYNKRNAYDKFSILNNRIPPKEMVVSVVPDYVTLDYSCVVITEKTEQINKIIEAVNFASDSYWGDINRFKFRARVDSYSTVTELQDGADRINKVTFTLILNGYIIPDSINKEVATIDAFYTQAEVVFGLETTSGDVEQVSVTKMKDARTGGTSVVESTYNITVTLGNVQQSDLEYLTLNKSLKADIITTNTATFNNTRIVQPVVTSTLPPTTVDMFSFFINGVYVSRTAITSLSQVGSNVVLTVDPNILGYTLSSTDEVMGIGKFE